MFGPQDVSHSIEQLLSGIQTILLCYTFIVHGGYVTPTKQVFAA